MNAPELTDRRLRDLAVRCRWDWVIQSFDAEGRFMLETVHRGEASRDMELRAIEGCGRTAVVTDLRPYRQSRPLGVVR